MALTAEQKIIRLFAMYAINPIAWVQDRFEGRFEMTDQHKQFFTAAGNLIKAKLRIAIEAGLIDNPDVIAIVGNKVTEEDREYAGKIGISVSSGQGVGKDAAAAVMAWFFLDVFPYPKVMITAPSGNTLSDVIWAELSQWRRQSNKINPKDVNSKSYLEHYFTLQSEKIFHNFHGEKGKEWFAVARTISPSANPDSQAETLAGRHAPFMLFIVDEATGVDDPVFKPLEGSLTGIVNLAILIFNPTRTKGFAINSHFGGDTKRWVQVRWNAEESPRVSKEHIKIMADRFDKDSNPYRIRVLGLPPRSESDALIPPDWLEDAKVRCIEPTESDPLIMSFDCGAGTDTSVICLRKGGRVFPFRSYSTKDSNMLVSWVRNLIIDLEPDVFIGDSRGWGWHVMGEIRKDFSKSKIKVVSFDSSESAKSRVSDTRFFNWRAEAYWRVKTVFENCLISIPNNYNLIDQLSVTKIADDVKGRFKIIVKSKIKKLMTDSGTSPNEADTLAMNYAFEDTHFKKISASLLIKKVKAKDLFFGNNNQTAWMGR